MSVSRPAPDLIGESPVFLDALAHASRVAALDRPLLIFGERGAGKELFAGRIHFLSTRWEGPLVKVNCAALSDDLLESELFGHEAGAFTGAQRRRIGRFERADGGTLFLDEIPSASARVQEKLLRAIEYGEYERLGGETTLTADVRIVAAANVDLRPLAESGAFRADLLDRLAFDVVRAPPLRERPEDVALLAAHFAARIATEAEASYRGFTASAMALLREHKWPGNVRELKNVAERSAYRWISDGRDGPIDEVIIDPFEGTAPTPSNVLPDAADPQYADPENAGLRNAKNGSIDLRAHLNDVERRLVLNALKLAGGSQKDAAELLALNYNQIRGLVRKHELSTK